MRIVRYELEGRAGLGCVESGEGGDVVRALREAGMPGEPGEVVARLDEVR
ncbi:MAG: Rv2993c-like domain-containing protein, partial [Pseudonocardia sp.]